MSLLACCCYCCFSLILPSHWRESDEGRTTSKKKKNQKPPKTKQKTPKEWPTSLRALKPFRWRHLRRGMPTLSKYVNFPCRPKIRFKFPVILESTARNKQWPQKDSLWFTEKKKCPSARTFWKLNGPLSQVVSPLSLEVFKTGQGMWSYISFYHIYNKGCYIRLLLLRKVWMLGVGGQR